MPLLVKITQRQLQVRSDFKGPWADLPFMQAISGFRWFLLRFSFGVSVESSAARSEFLASRSHHSLKV